MDSSSDSSVPKQQQEEVNFGRSLLVPSVQELAKEQNTEIPHRYIRSSLDDEDCPANIGCDPTSSSLPTVPVIDIQTLLSGDISADSELETLHSACKDWGFFQVVNQGVSSSLIEKIKLEIHDFFELPLGETLEAYLLELKELAITIVGRMAEALKMDSKEMRGLFNNGFQSTRLNYYPPCSQAKQVLGITPYSDADALMILLQLNETKGLQMRNDGKWIPVKPIPNAFVVNVGDMMEIVSNGVYHSIEHRVVVNSTKEIATFFSTNLDAELGPAHSLIDPPHKPALFKRVTAMKYYKDFFSRKLDKKSYLDFMRIENGQDNNSN